MKKKLLIIFSIIVILLLITSIFIWVNSKNNSTYIAFETSQTNIIDSDSLNIIENIESEIVNEFTNETVIEIANVDSPSNESTSNSHTVNTSNEKITTPNPTNVNTNTKEETKSNTKIITSNTTNKSTKTTNEVKQETPSESTNTQSSSKVNQEIKTPTTESAKPELAYSTYRVINNDIVPEIIKILNDEISKDSELVNYGCKALKGNKSDAYAKTSGFTYLWVKDIEKGKTTGNYTIFTQRVRNTVGGFANYNVYAEDEYTYNAQGLNPHWSQTLVWIYLTF